MKNTQKYTTNNFCAAKWNLTPLPSDDRMTDENFSVIHKSKISKRFIILPAVWQLKRKRDIKPHIKIHKVRLNIECSRMKQGICYDQTYTPVSSWSSICILLIMVSVHICYTKQLDCVELLPQALVEQELYMQIPKGIKLYGKDSNYYMLQLHTNTHGQKILTEYGINN